MARSRWWKDRERVDSAYLDPNDKEDFHIDFSPYLATNGETVASYTVSGAGVTITGDSESQGVISFDASSPNTPYGSATFQVTTSSDRKRSATVRFYSQEK